MFQHMREVAQRRQQLELEHEQARLSLQEKQEEVRRLQQVGSGAGKGGCWVAEPQPCRLLAYPISIFHLPTTMCETRERPIRGS